MTEGLQLSEKQPGYGHITVLVGPDGGGKTYLANRLAQEHPKAILIDGTHPQKWPVSEQKKRIFEQLKDLDGFDYYGAISLELHKMILSLAKTGKDVIVDSEQTFKFLMWEDMRGNLEKATDKLRGRMFKAVMPDSIRYVVPQADNFEQQAELVWEQQSKKPISERSRVDPTSLEQVKTRLHSSEHVILALEKLGVEIEGKPSWVK